MLCFVSQNKSEKWYFSYVSTVAKNVRKKKTNETLKEKLLNSIRQNDVVEKQMLNIGHVTDSRVAIITNNYEDIIKTQKKKNNEISYKTETDAEEVYQERRLFYKCRTTQIKYLFQNWFSKDFLKTSQSRKNWRYHLIKLSITLK